jgi:hypothetical protein
MEEQYSALSAAPKQNDEAFHNETATSRSSHTMPFSTTPLLSLVPSWDIVEGALDLGATQLTVPKAVDRMTRCFITETALQGLYTPESHDLEHCCTCTCPGRMHQVAGTELSGTTPGCHASTKQCAAYSKGARIAGTWRH